MNNFLDHVYFNNTLREYLIALAIIVLGISLVLILKKTILRRLRAIASRTSATEDDFFVDGISRFGIPVLQWAIAYWALNSLDLSTKSERVIEIVNAVIVTYFVIRFLSSVIMLLLNNHIRRQEHGEEKIKQLGGLMIIINVFIWILGLVYLLDNLGHDVTTIITGLGIGGIAIALAAQNILGDLFNYFVIFFDRPFEVGDFITVDDKMGTVEYVGIKTTRIRSLSGEQLIIGNSNLTGSRIHNFKRLASRRVVFTLNLDYRTTPDKLRLIPDIIKVIIESQQKVRFDRSHFANYGDWSLRIETVYFFLDPDYNKFMDVQQEINLKIYEALQSQEIYFVTGFHISLAPPPPPVKEEANKVASASKD